MTGFNMKCNTGLKWANSCCQSNRNSNSYDKDNRLNNVFNS